MFNHTFLARLFLGGLGVVGFYTAAAEIGPEKASLIPCIFHLVTEVPCPGCGMTRACLSITHGHFGAAWHYHPFSFLIIGLAIGAALFPIRLKNIWSRCSPGTRNVLTISGIVLCLFAWIHKLGA